ncbi:MAG: hypothetical protein V8T36_06875 [Ruthenibacterium lactatiformans]
MTRPLTALMEEQIARVCAGGDARRCQNRAARRLGRDGGSASPARAAARKDDYFNNVFLPVLILQVAVIYLFVPFITTCATHLEQKGSGLFPEPAAALSPAAGAAEWRCSCGGAFPSLPPARKF